MTGASGAVYSVYQPIVSVTTGVVVGYEALARFDSGEPPDVALSQLGQGSPDAVAMEIACVRSALSAGPPPAGARLWVNIGASALCSDEFAQLLPAIAAGTVLELTEHESVTDYSTLRSRRAMLRDLDLLLAIDDVGAGYSTLAHVLQLQPEYLKIDREIVAAAHEDASRRDIVRALTGFCRSAGAMTVAEGIEAIGELAAMSELGVDLVQGYLIGRPGPPWVRPTGPVRTTGGLRLQWALESLAASQTLPGMVSAICEHLLGEFSLVPSIYLARGDVLRRIGGRGQWQVLDGMPSGIGITGRTFASGDEILVEDVRSDPDYLEALPGVVAEMCVPIVVGGSTVGVLNVDATARISGPARLSVRRLAAALGRRLEETGAHDIGESALHRLARSAAVLAGTSSRTDLLAAIVDSAVAVSGLESAGLWLKPDGRWDAAPDRSAFTGPLQQALAELSEHDLDDVERLVTGVASCYTTGNRDDPAFPQAVRLRARGADALVVVPLRSTDDAGGTDGLLVAAHGRPVVLQADVVEALELLSAHASTCLHRLDAVRQLRRQARRDHLTGALNRAAFDEELSLRFATSVAEQDGASLLLLADIDGFKDVNDHHGHLEGDRVLTALVSALRAVLRPGDALFRLGGDEFAVLVRVPGASAAVEVAERLCAAGNVVLSPVGAALSIGHTLLEPASPSDGPDAAVRRADAELYRRKAASPLPAYRRNASRRSRVGR